MKIGLFDSGLGGLTILKQLQKDHPSFDFVFVADYAYNPYGIKSYDVIQKRVELITDFLKTCDVIIIACNTASIHADSIKMTLPVYGVTIPTCLYATKRAKSHVGILATNKTIADATYQTCIKSHNLTPIPVKASELVDIVEQGKINTKESIEVYQEKLNLLKEADTIILGCTHFELLEKELKKLEPNKTFISSGIPVSKLLNSSGDKTGETHLYVTKENAYFNKMVRTLRINYKTIDVITIE